jgi:hypothetical protein
VFLSMPEGKRGVCALWQLPATAVLCGSYRQLQCFVAATGNCSALWQLPANAVRILQNLKEFDENESKKEISATKNTKDGRLSNLLSISGFSLL